MSDTTSDDEHADYARPFADFLAELRKGSVHDELTEKFHELIAAVMETRKPGTITLTIKASVHKGTDMLAINDAVAVKVPRLDRPQSLWFTDAAGNPCRNDPSQLAFEGIRAVPTPTDREAKQA
ncbi:hypothetical protein [Nocardia farcinica]|uniref:hypothetical protein n=1 Tax=Nocardia farcinica TaxID=37329 RepID=UPI002454624E|nr:hypothetical protein [Nocardia farcinica]